MSAAARNELEKAAWVEKAWERVRAALERARRSRRDRQGRVTYIVARETLDVLERQYVAITEEAELAVQALLPLLPLSGSWNIGYRVNELVAPEFSALPEELAEAAHRVAELHAALDVFAVAERGGTAAKHKPKNTSWATPSRTGNVTANPAVRGGETPQR